MTDHFDKWINSMSDMEYEDWLDDDATSNQEEKALNIRTPLSKEEEEEIEAEQVYVPETARREIEVYDNRDLPPKRITRTLEIPQQIGAPIIIKPIEEGITMVRPAIPQDIRRILPQKKESRLRRVLTSFFARFRRKKK